MPVHRIAQELSMSHRREKIQDTLKRLLEREWVINYYEDGMECFMTIVYSFPGECYVRCQKTADFSLLMNGCPERQRAEIRGFIQGEWLHLSACKICYAMESLKRLLLIPVLGCFCA